MKFIRLRLLPAICSVTPRILVLRVQITVRLKLQTQASEKEKGGIELGLQDISWKLPRDTLPVHMLLTIAYVHISQKGRIGKGVFIKGSHIPS